MDFHMRSNSQPQFGVNGATGQNHRLGDDPLQFLSQEEKECLSFFEQTIDSMEQSLKEDELRPQRVKPPSRGADHVDGASVSGPHTGVSILSSPAKPANQKEQDIIDLVQTKETSFFPTSPDSQSLMSGPESHFQMKSCCDPVDTLPSEYTPPLPSSCGPTDSHQAYHPPGCIPTPVLIAQKIAENQASGTSGSSLSASSLLRQRSVESEKSASSSNLKHGPPTSTKPSRYPSNISVILGNKEHQNQPLGNKNIEERRAQMLSNLSGTPQPLLQEESQQDTAQAAKNTPTRSVSFRDPTPEKSRMQALSKLGLNRNRTLSEDVPFPSTPLEPLTGAEARNLEQSCPPELTTSTSSNLLQPSFPPNIVFNSTPQELRSTPNLVHSRKTQEPSIPPNIVFNSTPQELRSTPNLVHSRKTQEPSIPTNVLTSSYVDRKPEIRQTDAQRGLDNRYQPTAFTQNDYFPPPPVESTPFSSPPEAKTAEFNSYGGKSIIVNPAASFQSEPVTSTISHEPKSLLPALAHPSEFNSYGGKTKVMSPAPVAVTRKHLPDILSSHMDKGQSFPTAPEHISTELNSYGGKSRSINPTVSSGRPSEGLSRTLKPPAPAPAPRPPRHSYHGPVAPKASLSPEQKRRSGSLFRPQGITVQFSGKGATDESRKEALRRLGLLKD